MFAKTNQTVSISTAAAPTHPGRAVGLFRPLAGAVRTSLPALSPYMERDIGAPAEYVPVNRARWASFGAG